MASITLRGTRWHARVRVHKHPTVCKAFAKRSEATAWARELEHDIARGKFSPTAEATRMTFGEAIDRYRDTVTPTKKGRAQESSLVQMLRAHPEYAPLCRKRLVDVRPTDIALQRDRWLMAGLAPATVRNRLALFSHLFAIAGREWGVPIANPVAMIRKPQATNERARRLIDDEEFSRVLAASKSGELPDIATLALETAMRLSEIVGLEWDRVELDRQCVSLRKTKSGHSRYVPLSPVALALLTRRHMLRTPGRNRVFAIGARSASMAWASARSRARMAYRASAIERHETPREGYLEDLRFHDLRHEALSRMAEGGLDVLELSAIGGHRTLSMLQRYTHLKATSLAQKLALFANVER